MPPSTVSPPYSDAFNRAISFVLPHEDEYARGHWGDPKFVIAENVSGDSGGVTKFGIDASSHPGVNIRDLTEDDAVAVYHSLWLQHRLDLLSPRLAIAVFDVLVNGGQPILWLQQAYNATHQGNQSDRLVEDGYFGPDTLKKISSANEDVLLRFFFQKRDARFRLLATKYPVDSKFLSGWLQRDADLEKFLNVFFPSAR